MLKNASIIVIIFAGLFLSFHQTVFSQTENAEDKEWDAQETEILKSDYKQVDAVLYVDIKEIELVNSIGTGNCKELSGGGYCLYRLKAEVKEVFKGKIKRENFEFFTVIEASTGSKNFLLGEKIVFLEKSNNFPDKKKHFGTLENSTRAVKGNMLEKMRKIAGKNKSAINKKNGDDSGYFSYDFLKSDFKQVDVVAYVVIKEIISVSSSDNQTDCVNFTGIGYCGFLLRAEIKELYKGKIKTKTIEFSEGGEASLIRSKDRFLGERLVFLEKFVDSGKTHLQALENSTRWIENGVIAKMRKISAGN